MPPGAGDDEGEWPPADTGADAGGPARAALAEAFAGLVTVEGVDPGAARDAAALACHRTLVAAGAVAAGRVDGEWPPADPAALSDRVGAAYPGDLFDDDGGLPGSAALSDASVPPERRRTAVDALSGLVGRGGSGRVPVPLGSVHESFLGVTAAAAPADGDGGDRQGGTVLAADDHGGPAVALAATDDRRGAGAHYTPPAVVDGVVATALDPLGGRIPGREGVGTGDERPGAPPVSVLDPAVGTGRFLVGAVEYLTDAVVGEGGGSAAERERERVRRRVAAECVYGVDVDPVAVELARAGLWLATGADAGDHLRVGDALLGPGPGADPDDGAATGGPEAGTVAEWDPVDWRAAFPGVLGDGGFDAVVGNPPYVRSRALPDDLRTALRERYRTVGGTFDLYVPFVERAAGLGDRVALLVPNKWTAAEYGRDLRAALRREWGIEAVVDCSTLEAFPDADVYPVVLSFAPGDGGPDPGGRDGDRGGGGADRTGVRVRTATDDAGVGPAGGEGATVAASLLDALGGVVPVGIGDDPALAATVERVVDRCDPLGEYATATEGIHTGNARGTLVVDDPDGGRCRRLADGRSIERYRAEPSGEWVRYDPDVLGDGEYADLRDPGVFEPPKLLVRDVSDRPVAAFDDRGLYALNTLYAVHPTGGLPAKYLLAVIHSSFVERFFRAAFGGARVRDGYLRFKPTYLDRVPVPDPDPDRLATATRRRLAAHPATPVGRPGGIDRPGGVTAALAALTDVVARAKELDGAVDADPAAYFDPGDADAALGELSGVRRVPGVDATPLVETTRDRDGLRVGRATVRAAGGDDGGDLLVRATARYKPDGDAAGTDRWGYVETDPIPALRVDRSALGAGAGRDGNGDGRWAATVRAVVPAVFAGELPGPPDGAAKTIAPVERVEAVGIPRPGSPAADARGYRRARRRSGALSWGAAAADALLDRAVADLYGLGDRERALVARPGRERG